MTQEKINFLMPEFQDIFWKELNPDIRSFLNICEEKEDWTYSYEEVPELFKDIASALPFFKTYPVDDDTKKVLDDLIPLLSSMQLKQSITAISWLDNNTDNTDLGWAVICYLYASSIYTSDKDNKIYLEAKIICERIKLILQTRISTLLFLNLENIEDNNE